MQACLIGMKQDCVQVTTLRGRCNHSTQVSSLEKGEECNGRGDSSTLLGQTACVVYYLQFGIQKSQVSISKLIQLFGFVNEPFYTLIHDGSMMEGNIYLQSKQW